MTKKLIIEHCSKSKARFWGGKYRMWVEQLKAKKYDTVDDLPERIRNYKKVMRGKVAEYHGPKGTRAQVVLVD